MSKMCSDLAGQSVGGETWKDPLDLIIHFRFIKLELSLKNNYHTYVECASGFVWFSSKLMS